MFQDFVYWGKGQREEIVIKMINNLFMHCYHKVTNRQQIDIIK